MQDTTTTMQVLHFIDAKMDSAMPVFKTAAMGAANKVEHFGMAWAKFRALEFAGNAMLSLLGFFIGVFLCATSYHFFKRVTVTPPKSEWGSATPDRWLYFGIVFAVIGFMTSLFSLVGMNEDLPRAVAGLFSPEGFAVQLLIDGIKK